MAAGLLARGDQQQLAVLHALQLALHDAGLGRVALVVGRIDGEQRRRDALEARRGVVVARGVPIVEEVVGVGLGRGRDALLQQLVGQLARRRLLLVGQRAADGGDAEEHIGHAEGLRLLGVVAALPRRIVAHGVDDHAPHHPVAARHLGGLRGHRHQRIHEVGIGASPQPHVHAAHRVADDEAHALEAQPLGGEPVLRQHHVVVVVARELGAHAVGRFR